MASLFVSLVAFWAVALNTVVAQEQALQSASDYSDRGVACMRKDDFDGAIANFNKAITINSKDALNYFKRGLAYKERGVDRRSKGDLIRALNDFNKAIELDPHNASYYFGRGAVKLYQWKDQEAEQDFQKSLEIDSTQKASMERVISVIKRRRKSVHMR